MEGVILETTSGGILKEIREKLNISLSDIAGNDLDIDLIKLIESDKISLETENAEIICKNINSVLEQREMDLIIEPEDLFDPRRYYAKERVETYISQWDKHRKDGDYIIDEDDLDDLEFILSEYNLMDKKLKVYELIGDIYREKKDYENSYIYYLRGHELIYRYPNRKSNYLLTIKLGTNYIYRGKYQDAVSIFQNTLINIDNIPEKYLIYIYYNYALAYFRLKMYSSSLKVISDLLRYIERKDYDLWRRTYNLQGLCYLEKGEYESALSSYNNALQVLTFTGYSDLKYLIYGNIAETYTKVNDENRAYKYVEAVLEDIDKLDKSSYSYSQICNQLAISYENLGEFKKAEKYYKESLKYAKENIQQDYILKNLTALMELNTKIEVEDIFKIMEEYYESIVSDIKINNSLLIIFKYLKTYTDSQEYLKLERLIDSIIKIKGE
ncbi:tetratricopeptide repeat protein [Tissierella carlieri]|nr:tetratricopeptide repeat protein [Tissierella carlieri]MBU5313926.1 tetratricopeptide repeat protein [Tissierella carlieri]